MRSEDYWTEKKLTLRHVVSAWFICGGLVAVLAIGAQLLAWATG